MRAKIAILSIITLLPMLVCAQTVTPNLGLQIPAYQQANWQVPYNYDLSLLDSIIAGTQTLPVATATPTISEYANWVTANTSAIGITNFIGGVPGQPLRVICGTGDTYTSISSTASINMVSAWSCVSSNSISFILIGSVWQETGRAGGITGSTYLLLAGGTLTGELITNASSPTNAGLNLPPGSAPTSPVNGDLWTTSGGLYARIAGATVGPFGTGGGGMIYPGAGIPNSTGSAWTTSYSTSGSGNVCLTNSCSMTTPNIGVATATTVNGLTLTSNATGFSIAGGTTSKTLTVTTSGTLGTGAFATIANYAPLGGATFTGKLTTVASTTSNAGMNLPQGNAPTSPANGDLWATSAGLYAYINGGTVGPFGAAGGGGMIYPSGSGVPVVSSGVSWGTTLGTSGSGNVCLTTSCVMTTPNLGTPTALTLTNATGLPLATGVTGILSTANAGTGTPASGEYVDGGTGAWTILPTGTGNTNSQTGLTTTSTGAQTVTIVTPAANTLYSLTVLPIATTAAAGCSNYPSVLAYATWTDALTSVAETLQNQSGAAPVQNLGELIGQNSGALILTIYAKAGVAVRGGIYVTTAAAGCSTYPLLATQMAAVPW